MKRNILIVVVVVALVAAFSVPASLAWWEGKKSEMSMQSKGPKEKFMGSVHCVLRKRDELKLTDEQIDQIKKLSADVKKKCIQQKAEISMLDVDIHTLMGESPRNTKDIHALIAKKHDLKVKKEQELVSACDKLDGILTAEQQKEFSKCGR